MGRGGARTGEGKVKINENGEYYIERRGRKPGKGGKRGGGAAAGQAGRVGVQRRASTRTTTRRGASAAGADGRLEDLQDRYTSRRSLLFKSVCPSRTPSARAAMRFVESASFQKIRYRVGDVVAVTDRDDGRRYFAQIRGLVVNPLMEISAYLTWLIPKKTAVDPHSFDPEHFAHGLVDATKHPINICEWHSARPGLPAYRRLWSKERVAAEETRANLENNWKSLLKVAEQELLKTDQKPLMDLVERRNAEVTK